MHSPSTGNIDTELCRTEMYAGEAWEADDVGPMGEVLGFQLIKRNVVRSVSQITKARTCPHDTAACRTQGHRKNARSGQND